jgi:FAS-associated factor 2
MSLQKAVELLFDEPPPSMAAPSQPTGRGVEQFQIDEPNYNARPPTSMTGSTALSILSWPITFTFNLLSYLLRLLRIPIPRVFSRPLSVVLNWNAFASLWRPARRDPPGVVAERWVRTLEDEVGALTWARLRAADAIPDSVKEIPDFYLGSYGDVLNTAKRELKILCVVLVSDEHDDVPRFKRYVHKDRLQRF